MQVLLIIVISLHLVCVLTAGGAPLIALVLHGRRMQRRLDVSQPGGAKLILWSIVGLWVGTFLGVLIGWLKWDDVYSAKLSVLSNRVFYLGLEWLFSMVLLSCVYWWWRRNETVNGWRHVFRALLILLASLNLLHHFPVFFSAMGAISNDVALAGGKLSSSQFNEMVFQTAAISKTLHVVMASIMIGAASLTLLCTREYVLGGTVDQGWSRLAQWAARTTFVTFVIIVPTGIWAVMNMTEVRMDAIMGDDPAATVCFGLAMLLVVAQMHQWSQIAFGKVEVRKVAQAVTTLITTVILMTGISQLS
ncbi:MAG: hypothetical protein MK006_13860 [Pirellulales bacterium]|nr:hypothetical protein [Pirellulales bacterium]